MRTASEEAEFTRDLAAVDPALVAVFNQATADLDPNRDAAARAGFEKILARAPDHAPTLRRLSYVVGASGDTARALELARHAMRATPDRDGKFAVAEALLRKRDPASLQEANDLAEDLMRDDPRENDAALVAQIATARQDISLMDRAVTVLERRAPAGLATYFLGAIYHAALNQPDEAEALL